MARPKKEYNEKSTESFVVRLNQDDYNTINNYANSLGIIMPTVIVKFLLENGCFEYDINDDLYSKILKLPEAGQVVPRVRGDVSIRKIKIVRCWVTKKQKKSLAYCALTKHNVSPSVFVNDLLKRLLSDIKQGTKETETKPDILIKNLWTKVSDGTKKELLDEFLRNSKK